MVCTGLGTFSVKAFLALLNSTASQMKTSRKLPIRREDLIGELYIVVHYFPHAGYGVVLLPKAKGMKVRVFQLSDDLSYIDPALLALEYDLPSLKRIAPRNTAVEFENSRLIHVENTPADSGNESGSMTLATLST